MLTHSDMAVAAAISTPSAAAVAATSGTTASAPRNVRGPSNRRQHSGAAGSHSRAAAAGGTAPSAGTAHHQQRQLLKQLAQLLQTLYGPANTATKWNTLLSGSKAVTRFCWCSVADSLMIAAAQCLYQGIMNCAINVSLQQQQQQFLESQADNLHALHQLPVLLLRGMCSAAAAAPARCAEAYLGITAALTLINKIVWCWRALVKLQSSCVSIQLQQLPSAELLQLLLQELTALLQLRSEAAAVLTTAAAAALSSHAANNAAAANRWQHGWSAAAAAAHDVTLLDSCVMELLEILRALQTVSQYAVWQPHSTRLTAAVEHGLKNSSSHGAASATASINLCMSNSVVWHQELKFADNATGPEGNEPRPLPRAAAAAAAPGSREQQQLFSLLISLIKRISNLQQLGFEAHGEVPLTS